MLLENVRDGAPSDLLALIGQRALYPPVTPIPVLCCHVEHKVRDFILAPGSSRATLVAAIAFLGDQFPVSGQKRLRREDCGRFLKDKAAKPLGLGCQAPALLT